MPAKIAPAARPPFVHLRLHTEYSLVDGIVRVPELMQAVAAAGMPAVALTDHGNLFAMVKFHREAEKRGVKPLIVMSAGSSNSSRPNAGISEYRESSSPA
jgi:DNA polymerase-3 subunit alpha